MNKYASTSEQALESERSSTDDYNKQKRETSFKFQKSKKTARTHLKTWRKKKRSADELKDLMKLVLEELKLIKKEYKRLQKRFKN